MNSMLIQLDVLAPAFLAGVAVLASHVPLGREVLSRGIIFIDLAIAQFAALGLIIAAAAGFEASGIGMQLVAMTGALLGALLLILSEKRVGKYQEALIGILFVLASTAGVLVLAGNPHSNEHLQSVLIGQILWTEYDQLWLPAGVGICVMALSILFKSLLNGRAFYWIFAIAITSSVQVVGVFLVFASLILPAFSAILIGKKQHALVIASGIGILAYAAGLIISLYSDLPAGPLIIWCMAIPVLVSLFKRVD